MSTVVVEPHDLIQHWDAACAKHLKAEGALACQTALAYIGQEKYEDAARQYADLLKLAERWNENYAKELSLYNLCAVAVHCNNTDCALRWCERALRLLKRRDRLLEVARVSRWKADLLRRIGTRRDLLGAIALIEQAHDGISELCLRILPPADDVLQFEREKLDDLLDSVRKAQDEERHKAEADQEATNKGTKPHGPPRQRGPLIMFPVLTKAAAGRPLTTDLELEGQVGLSEIWDGDQRYQSVSFFEPERVKQTPKWSSFFFVKVEGRSMTEANIEDGDYLMVRHDENYPARVCVVTVATPEQPLTGVVVKKVHPQSYTAAGAAGQRNTTYPYLVLESAQSGWDPIVLYETLPDAGLERLREHYGDKNVINSRYTVLGPVVAVFHPLQEDIAV